MLEIIAAVCLLVLAVVTAWFSPLRPYLLRFFPALDRCRFTCHVEQFTDESLPAGEDQVFRVRMIGRIPTDRDQVQTDVRLQIQDVTDGRSHPQQVFCADEAFHSDGQAEFHFIKDNDVIPEKNAILACWATVAEVPCHILHFSHRGRRKLLFSVTILETESGREVVTARKVVEHVYCSDGYREVHTRRRDVLRSCVELAAFSIGSKQSIPDTIKAMWTEWIQQKSDIGMPAEEMTDIVTNVEQSSLSVKESSEILLAYGQNTDTFLAMELALQTVVLNRTVSAAIFNRLSQIAQALAIRHDRFLAVTQKTLLASECHIEEPSCLLGIDQEMDEQAFRKRLNEEYRKWNARVTHPDPEIRQQADQILTLIAEIRTQRLQACS